MSPQKYKNRKYIRESRVSRFDIYKLKLSSGSYISVIKRMNDLDFFLLIHKNIKSTEKQHRTKARTLKYSIDFQ